MVIVCCLRAPGACVSNARPALDEIVLDVAQRVAAARAWLEFAHFAQRADVGSESRCRREIVVVERVLAAVVAADVAFAAQPTRVARAAVQVGVLFFDRLARDRVFARVGERDRQVGQEPVQAEFARRFLEGARLRDCGVWLVRQRKGLRVEHLLDAVVVRLEVVARDGPVLEAAVGQVLFDEPALVLADEHVGVNQRPAAQSAADQRLDALERPQVEHAVQAGARVPEIALRPIGRARKRVRRERLARARARTP